MKKYIILVLLMMVANVNAESSSHSIGRVTTFIGTTISLSVTTYNARKSIFIYTRGRHRIRKAAASMSKDEAIRLRDLLNKAILELE